MDGLIILEGEQRVHHAKGWGWVLKLLQDRSAINVVQEHVKFVQLVREAPIINEEILNSMAAF
jgi:hypothetical protein